MVPTLAGSLNLCCALYVSEQVELLYPAMLLTCACSKASAPYKA
jgi:hypothetical protein